MAKDVVFSEDARIPLKTGVDNLSNAVKITLGARGSNVLYTDFLGQPGITGDGVTVADDISFDDER